MSESETLIEFTYKSPPWIIWYLGGAVLSVGQYMLRGPEYALSVLGLFLLGTALGVGMIHVTLNTSEASK